MVAGQGHQERMVAEVRDEAIGLVQLAELLVDVDLFLGLVGADAAERERRGLEDAVARGILADRAAGGPGYAPLDADLTGAQGLFQGGGGLFLDELGQLLARLEALR